MSIGFDQLRAFINSYEEYLSRSFEDLWSKVTIETDKLEAYSVIGTLLARQVTLSIQLARSPATWNGHAAPLFLRPQTDLRITIAWILGDLADRARKFVLHGLGEEKLLVEQYKKEIEDNPDASGREAMERIIEAKTSWINSQRYEWMVEVNLGHWAYLDTRQMAQEAGCESLYKFAYKPFSVAAHNMWPHVSIYNGRPCKNSLHRYHIIPELIEVAEDLDFLYRSCKYVHRTYESFVEKFEIILDEEMPLDWWDNYIDQLKEDNAEDE